MKYEIFISYSRKDGETARKICELLDEAGVSYYINPDGNDEDKDFPEEQIAKIKSCEKMLFVASIHAYKSALALREIYHSFQNIKKSNIYLYQIDGQPLPKSINALFLVENRRNITQNPLDASFVCDICHVVPQPVKQDSVESEQVVVEVPKPEPKPEPQPKVAPNPKPVPRPSTAPAARCGRPASLDAMPKKRSKTGLIIGIVAGLIVLTTAILTLVTVSNIGGDGRVNEYDVYQGDPNDPFSSAKLPVDNKTTYKVGDIYNKNGKCGVVFEVSHDGKHGKILSFDTSQQQWSSEEKYQQGITIGALGEDDGKYNTDLILGRGNGYDYPAANWCRMKGSDWYLPAIRELEVVLLNPYVCRAVNQTLHSVGAPKLHTYGETAWYWSSTEYRQNPALYASLVRTHDAQVNYGYKYLYRKNGDPYVRAVAIF